jgi:hypothetical protein
VFGYSEIVLGPEPEPKAALDMGGEFMNMDELRGYKDQDKYASRYLIKTVDSAWLMILMTYKPPPKIGEALLD